MCIHVPLEVPARFAILQNRESRVGHYAERATQHGTAQAPHRSLCREDRNIRSCATQNSSGQAVVQA